jgi:hypothetical protein
MSIPTMPLFASPYPLLKGTAKQVVYHSDQKKSFCTKYTFELTLNVYM